MSKSLFERDERERLIVSANEAKERLDSIAYQLEELGYVRKAKSLMTIVYRIEEWQNKN